MLSREYLEGSMKKVKLIELWGKDVDNYECREIVWHKEITDWDEISYADFTHLSEWVYRQNNKRYDDLHATYIIVECPREKITQGIREYLAEAKEENAKIDEQEKKRDERKAKRDAKKIAKQEKEEQALAVELAKKWPQAVKANYE